ncbi:MAG TPA: glycosyltransferase family 4 protein [Pyrinomonadaceae bacterium]|nr:glycosyltransferase family 4 protein [Pyrinomonadaceae bacterium]
MDTPELTEIIKRHKYDAVIVAGWHYKSAWQAIRACWKSQTPVMVRSDSHLHSNRSGVKSVGKWPFYRWFIPRFDACLPVGQWSREYFMHYGARPEKIFIVPHAVDDTFFSRELKRLTICRAELCSEWNLDVEAPVFLFAGKFVENKRPLDFLKAIDLIVKRGADVAGLMVGDGPLRGACEAFVSRERLPVRFTGFLNQSDMPKAYVVSNALVLPSEGETWGLVVNEAMIGGVPAFVSDQVGCAPDMISDGQTGYVYPVGNIEALAEFMFWFARDKPKQQHMGGEAEKKARSYSAMCGAQATLNAVRSVVGVQGRQS